jgi:hypothetical protein
LGLQKKFPQYLKIALPFSKYKNLPKEKSGSPSKPDEPQNQIG